MAGLYLGRSPSSAFDAELEALQQATLPPGGRIVSVSETARGQFRISASWVASCDMGRNEYSAWLKQQSLPGYTLKQRAENRWELIRPLDSDQLILTVEFLGNEPAARIRFTLTGFAS